MTDSDEADAVNSRIPEYEVLQALLERDFPGSAELRRQLNETRIERAEAAGSPALLFHFDHVVTAAPVVQRIPVEGHWGDKAGARVHCLLHVVGGVMKELEFFREDGAPIPSLPLAAQMQIEINRP